MAKLIVTDTKGIVVATWQRETITIPAGEAMEQNSLGQVSFGGKVLNLGRDIINRLINSRRLEIAPE